jgi:hypothetical protein
MYKLSLAILLQLNDASGHVNHGSNILAPIKYNSVAVGVCPIPDSRKNWIDYACVQSLGIQ